MNLKLVCFRNSILLSLTLALVAPVTLHSEVILDGSLGPAVALNGPAYVVDADLGQINGSNLFHSFVTFDLSSAESATFTGPGSISNVLGRVTGGSVSNIDGAINMQIPGANLYLVNPSGIVFGPNATLNLSGSFHASTAAAIRLGENGSFDATNSGNSVLVSAPPSAFGFLDQPGAISVNQSVLTVPKGKTLSLVAGNVTITGAPRVKQGVIVHPGESGFNCGASCLQAPGGRIQIASASANTDVPTDLSSADITNFGSNVSIENNYLIDVSDEKAGSVVIRGGAFTINTSEFRADSNGVANATAVAVDVATSGTVQFSNTVVGTRIDGAVKSGAIIIDAETIELLKGTRLESGSCNGCSGGTGGKIVLKAKHRLALQGVDHNGAGVKVTNNTKSGKNAGNITLTAGVEIKADGATVSSVTESSGNAGDLLLASKRIQIENNSRINSNTGIGGGGQGSGGNGSGGNGSGGNGSGGNGSGGNGSGGNGSGGNGSGGNGSGGNGSGGNGSGGGGSGQADGNGGSLLIRAEESITLQQDVKVGTNSNSSGNAGNVLLEAPRVEILDGSRVGSNVDASGDSGNITITATDSLILAGTNGNQNPNKNRGSRITVGSRSTATGNAGSINITATNITLDDGARVTSSTSGAGEGGSLNILADNSITLRGSRLDGLGSSIQAATEIEESEASDIGVPRDANAGTIFIRTGSLNLEPGTEIRTNTSLPGQGGQIEINAAEINMSGADILSTSTGDGSGDAGNIDIVADNNLNMTNSFIATSAAQADGGNIKLTVSDTLYLLNSNITAKVQGGVGDGGNINIDPIFVVLDNSDITAGAVGGNGGNIQIVSDFFLATPDSTVSATSALAIDGVVDIQSPDEEITSALSALPVDYLDVSALLRSRCGVRHVDHVSSFVVSGLSVLPIRPEDMQPALYSKSFNGAVNRSSLAVRKLSEHTFSSELMMSYLGCSDRP